MASNYDRIARFYDVDMALNMAFDDVGFYAEICRRKAGRVLELGCGNGRILLSLAAGGLDAIGVDASEGMLRDLQVRASARALPSRIARMDVRSLAFRCAFDVVMCPYSLVTILRARRSGAYAGRRRRDLRPGGLLVVDAFVPRPVVSQPEFRLDYRRPFGAQVLARSKRIASLTGNLNRIERRYEVRSGTDTLIESVDVVEEIRPYQPDELCNHVAAAGFELEAIWWDYHSIDRLPAAQFFTIVARLGGAAR